MILHHAHRISDECSPGKFWRSVKNAIDSNETIDSIMYADDVTDSGEIELLKFCLLIKRMYSCRYKHIRIVGCYVPYDVQYLGIQVDYGN